MKMIRSSFVAGLLLLAPVAASAASDADPVLTAEVAALDEKLFGAYNRCDLDAFARLFSSDVEFYHDEGGLTIGRDIVVENTRKYICGKVERVLIPGTLKVYPIKGFGAIEEGQHTFKSIAAGEGGGIAKFVMIWKKTGDQWQVTRVLSYGHVPGPDVK